MTVLGSKASCHADLEKSCLYTACSKESYDRDPKSGRKLAPSGIRLPIIKILRKSC